MLALTVAVAPAGAAEPPIDPYYESAIGPSGWLRAIGWSWSPLAAADAADRAFPTIAVVDGGVDPAQPEFQGGTLDPQSRDCSSGRAVAAAADFANVGDASSDGHGTMVAGIAAAPANGVGIVGVSPFSPVLAVRIRTEPYGNVDCALAWLAAYARSSGTVLVVNLSLVEDRATARRRALVQDLVAAGALVVAATGNGGRAEGAIGNPANLDHVLAVGDDGGVALRPGPQLDLVAPARDFVVPRPGGGFAALPGPATSWATPVVSGAAAVVWGLRPDADQLTAQQVAYLLRVGAGGHGRWSPRTGFGRVSIAGALRARAPRDDEVEPNDTAALAVRHANRRDCRRGCYGLIGRTDDAADWWLPTVRRGARVFACAGPGVRLRVARSNGRAFVRVTPTRPLVAYRLRAGATRCAGATRAIG